MNYYVSESESNSLLFAVFIVFVFSHFLPSLVTAIYCRLLNTFYYIQNSVNANLIEIKRNGTSMESDLAFAGFTFLMYTFCCWRLAVEIVAAPGVVVVAVDDCMGCTVGVGVGVGGSMLASFAFV